MNLEIACFTQQGRQLGERIVDALSESRLRPHLTQCGGSGPSVHEWTKEHFCSADALVFIGATGIAVRAIAPHVSSKTTDSAVLVLDESNRYLISLLSGHIGGANALAQELALLIGAEPVITTATDVHKLFAVDAWASRAGYFIQNPAQIKRVSSKLLEGETVSLRSIYDVTGSLPSGVRMAEAHEDPDIEISVNSTGSKSTSGTTGTTNATGTTSTSGSKSTSGTTSTTSTTSATSTTSSTSSTSISDHTLRLIPPALVLGVGCRRDTPEQALETALQSLLDCNNLCLEAVSAVYSIDLKAHEPGLISFCAHHNWPFTTFTTEELAAVSGTFSHSEFVQQATGVDNVCERSAVLGSGGTLLVPKTVQQGVALAVATKPWTIDFKDEQ